MLWTKVSTEKIEQSNKPSYSQACRCQKGLVFDRKQDFMKAHRTGLVVHSASRISYARLLYFQDEQNTFRHLSRRRKIFGVDYILFAIHGVCELGIARVIVYW
jgi:hypothetical protein